MLLFSTMLDINDTMTSDAFIQLVIEWNQGSPHINNVIPNIKWNGEHNIRFGEEGLWLAIEEYRNQNVIAVRYEKKEDDGAIWDTDYIMNFNSMKMVIRLDRSYTAEALEADQHFSTPHFITLLIERGYLKDDNSLPVLKSAFTIRKDNIHILADVINGKTHYNLPIVYVSKTYNDENPVNVAYLASRLKGVAHVLVEEGNWLNSELRILCNGTNEYYGAIGIYFPKKGMQRRRFFCRTTDGYDDILLERVCRAVIQYCSSQMVDTLFTWQGVNNALLRDMLISQREERLAAEAARKKAEEETSKLLDSIDEEERRFRKQAVDDARAEANALLESFDSETRKLQEQVEALTHANEALEFENQGLRAKIDACNSTPVLLMGDEYDFYPGEVKDLILSTLIDALKGIQPKTRRYDVVKDIVDSNKYQQLSETRAQTLKQILKKYDGMSARTKQALNDLGFEISEEGKHFKVVYYGDGRYQTAYAKTPSDGRSGINSAQQTIKLVF